MNSWWRDRVDIWLGATRIALARSARGLKPRVLRGPEWRPVVPEKVYPDAGATTWNASIEALERELAQAHWQHAYADLTLSSRFTRFCALPASANLLSTAEVMKLASATFESTYGSIAVGWRIAVAPGGPGRSLLASAIDQSLYQALERITSAARLKVRMVRPYFTAAFEIARTTVAWPAFWFACIESDVVCAGTVSRAGWQTVRTKQWDGSLTPSERGALLEALLQQTGAAIPEAVAPLSPVHVFAPRGLEIERPSESSRPWLRSGERSSIPFATLAA